MSLRVLVPGFFSTIQDLGRHGFQRFGVTVGGAMDSFVYRVANVLVGNDENCAALELTLQGGAYEFLSDTVFSICGADLSPVLNEKRISNWRPIFTKKGDVLTFGRRLAGFRAYLAVAGGFSIENKLGSYSTDVKAHFGGIEGRVLQKGDVLVFGKPLITLDKAIFSQLKWGLCRDMVPDYRSPKSVRVLAGAEFDLFSEESRALFVENEYRISVQGDRMGCRLEGPRMKLEVPREMISSAVTFGTVQVPQDGSPIILMADRQTIGGYPRIAQIVSVDLSVVAQMMPGERIRFQMITLEEAQDLFLEREMSILFLKKQTKRMYQKEGLG